MVWRRPGVGYKVREVPGVKFKEGSEGSGFGVFWCRCKVQGRFQRFREVRFHEGQGSTRVPPGFHQGSTRVPPGFHRGSTRFCKGGGVVRALKRAPHAVGDTT